MANAEIKADKGRLPEEEIDRMIAEAEMYRAQDEESGQKLQMKNGIEAAMYKALGQARDRGDEDAQEQGKQEMRCAVEPAARFAHPVCRLEG